jgi:hypothetical protein
VVDSSLKCDKSLLACTFPTVMPHGTNNEAHLPYPGETSLKLDAEFLLHKQIVATIREIVFVID